VNAEKLYKQALKKDKNYNLARLNLGNLYAATGRYQDARKILTEAQLREPDNAWVYYYTGNMYLRMSDYSQAVSAYNRAVSLNPNHAPTYYLLAVSLSKLKRMDEALQASLHYVQIAPDGEYAKELKSLIMAVKLSQSGGLYLAPAPAKVHLEEKQ
jgi:tetratricopeptide (TPR) repeat protein